MDVSLPRWTFRATYPFRSIHRRATARHSQDSDSGPARYWSPASVAKASATVTMTSMHTSALKDVASIVR